MKYNVLCSTCQEVGGLHRMGVGGVYAASWGGGWVLLLRSWPVRLSGM
jgi:hypothetical protein